jgi:hypothetical protein
MVIVRNDAPVARRIVHGERRLRQACLRALRRVEDAAVSLSESNEPTRAVTAARKA